MSSSSSVYFFATLRRKKDKTKGVAQGTVLVAESKTEPLFNSTPNLHKINPVVKHTGLPKGKESTAVFYPEEDVIEEDDSGDSKYDGFSSRRSSSAAAEGASHGEHHHGTRKLNHTKSKGSSGSLRHFASMITMFGSLKRTKSSRKMAYGSSQEFEQDKRDMSDFMRDRAAGKSPDPEDPYHSKSKLTNSSTHSTDSDINSEKRVAQKIKGNMEPGVRSSSSSSDDDDSRKSFTENDNTFKKSISPEKYDSEHEHNFDYTTTKSEEELKRTKLMIQGIKKFNMDPKKGIEFLVEHDILQNTPDDVAKFLKFGEGLSKTAIGTYLGEHIDFNEDVLLVFLDLHNFKDLILVQALRDFLWSFRLPGESQKIDRMMEAFAKRYCQSNPGIFTCTDTCFLLSYSIIMLNTTLHNPSVKDKPTVEQFIRMNRDVDCGKSLNKAFLVHQYNSILTEPFKIPPEDANDLVLTFFNPNIEGWLWKQGGYKTWKKRYWFILSNNCLYYFKFTTDKSPRGIIPLENVNAKEVTGNKSNELFPFILFKKSSRSMPSDMIKTCKTLSNGNTVLSQYHTITVASINQEDRKKWVQSINQNNSNSDFYDVLTLKKRDMEAARQQHPKGKRQEPHPETSKDTRTPIPKSFISQPSTAPGFEFKDKLPPEMLTPAGPRKDPNNYFKHNPVSSSHASISSGRSIEPDSSYGSCSDISRCRSESRILECSHGGSISSVEHDTGSLGSRMVLGIEERFHRGAISDVELREVKFDASKKLSVIEESQNQSDRSSSCSGANNLHLEDGTIVSHPAALKNRKRSDEDDPPTENKSEENALNDCVTGARSSDNKDCDNLKTSSVHNPFFSTSSAKHKVTYELSQDVQNSENTIDGELSSTTLIRYSRSGSIESDV